MANKTTVMVVTVIDENGFPLREVFVEPDAPRFTVEMPVPLKDGREMRIQIERIGPTV